MFSATAKIWPLLFPSPSSVVSTVGILDSWTPHVKLQKQVFISPSQHHWLHVTQQAGTHLQPSSIPTEFWKFPWPLKLSWRACVRLKYNSAAFTPNTALCHQLVGIRVTENLCSVIKEKETIHSLWTCFLTKDSWVLTWRMIFLLPWRCASVCSLRSQWHQMTSSCQSSLIDALPLPLKIRRILWSTSS